MGSARTALYNWAFARRHGGKLVLRIEDTDRERSTRESEAALVEGLTWLGIDWDEGPLRQSERAERYEAAVERLLAAGRAYRCTCTPEELEARRKASGGKVYDGHCRDRELGPDCGRHAVRLRMPDEGGLLGWEDAVFGPSGQDASEIGDAVIRRSDGHALYHLAVVVDDLAMEISHVIRGADHHSNTPLQLAIYRALDAEPPRFAHVPLIVGEGGKKLSKRRDPVAVSDYREEGFLPEAVVSWLVRLGWSHGDREIFDREAIRTLFDLDGVHRSPAQADRGKLLWLNQHYLKELPEGELVERLLPFLEKRVGRPVEASPELRRLADLLRERSRTLAEMAERAHFWVVDEVAYEEKAVRKHLRPEALAPLQTLHDRLAALPEWSEAAIEAAFEATRAEHDDLPLGKLAQPVRVAVTGTAASPGIFETLAVLGQTRTVGRIAEAIHTIKHG